MNYLGISGDDWNTRVDKLSAVDLIQEGQAKGKLLRPVKTNSELVPPNDNVQVQTQVHSVINF